MSSSDGAAASAAADGAAPARPGLGARLATLAERFRLPPATRLSLVILLTVFALVRASPDSTAHLALVPGHTVPRVWNLVTASWVEPTFAGVAVAVAALVPLGRAVEPGMGARETARFLLFVSAFVSACAFALSLARFHLLGKDEKALYDTHCGFQGIVAAMLVVLKRDAPDAPVNVRGLRWMRREQLCGAHWVLAAAAGVATGRWLSTFGFASFGLYGAWVYVRHVQLRPEGDVGVMGLGDSGADPRMDLVTFFPRRAAPFLSPPLDAAHEALCGRRQRRLAAAYGAGSLHAGIPLAKNRKGVTTDDAAEAQRRRERGAKALADRLALKAKKKNEKAPDAGGPNASASAARAASASGSTTRAEEDAAEAV